MQLDAPPLLRAATATTAPDQHLHDLVRPVRLRRVDLTGIGLRVAHSFGQSHRGRDLDFTIEDGLVATADPDLVAVLLEHLLTRAVLHTIHQPLAEIELRRVLVEAEAPFEPAQGCADRTVFVVRDNGVDTSVDHGLALASRIVERHAGSFRAVYGATRGASLYFSLPSTHHRLARLA